jgi:hypothetical protein
MATTDQFPPIKLMSAAIYSVVIITNGTLITKKYNIIYLWIQPFLPQLPVQYIHVRIEKSK